MQILHALQREVGRLAAPLWVPFAVPVLRLWFGYRLANAKEVRRKLERIRRENPGGPMLVCANHLTMIDSLLIAWVLAPPWQYVLHWNRLPWNTPESRNFGLTPGSRIVLYLAKCIPITRGGRRDEVAAVLDRVVHLTKRGELALIFPEGGRSRSGRVEAGRAAWGVGRIASSVPGCRVLCVYLRGDAQETWSDAPARGDRIWADVECIEPKSEVRGVRRSMDYARQIVAQLAQMETEYLARRQ